MIQCLKTTGFPFLVQDADAIHKSVGLVVLGRILYYVCFSLTVVHHAYSDLYDCNTQTLDRHKKK